MMGDVTSLHKVLQGYWLDRFTTGLSLGEVACYNDMIQCNIHDIEVKTEVFESW